MKCPRCAADDDRVVDSRTSADAEVIRRRRECLSCFMRFTTYERVEESPLRVVKKNGERVRFDREKIRSGFLRACEKLPVAMDAIETAVANIESKCKSEYDREVPSSVIGSLVMKSCATCTKSRTCASPASIASSKTSANSWTNCAP